MNYNDGKVHLEIYKRNKNRNKIAQDFSEGDQLLQEVLLELWNNNIKTTACCKGHSESSLSPAYISIIDNDDSKLLIKATCDYILTADNQMNLYFSNSFKQKGKTYNSFTVYLGNEKVKKEYFNFLLNFLNNKNEVDLNNRIPVYVEYLYRFASSLKLNYGYAVGKSKMILSFMQPGVAFCFDDDLPHLEDSIDNIIETRKIPLKSMFCDEKSLELFINAFYPNTFDNQKSISK